MQYTDIEGRYILAPNISSVKLSTFGNDKVAKLVWWRWRVKGLLSIIYRKTISNTHTGYWWLLQSFPPLSPRYQSCSCSGRDYSKITSYKSYILYSKWKPSLVCGVSSSCSALVLT